MVHGTGSNDADDSKVLGGAVYQSIFMVLPALQLVPRSSHLVINDLSSEDLLGLKNQIIPHDVVRCPRQLVSQGIKRTPLCQCNRDTYLMVN